MPTYPMLLPDVSSAREGALKLARGDRERLLRVSPREVIVLNFPGQVLAPPKPPRQPRKAKAKTR